MHENEQLELDARAREWAQRILETAESLQMLAIERKRDDDTWAALTMGTEGAGQVNPRIAFALPHSAAVLDCSLTLRRVAADYPVEAWRD
jgi:hypothetical protein